MRKRVLSVAIVSLFSALAVFAAKAGHPARLTTEYIDASVSLDYPGFAGLSVDSLGKEHYPLVTINPPGEPRGPVTAKLHGSRVEYRRPGAPESDPPRWAIEVAGKDIWLESHWSAVDPPEPLVFNADNHDCHVTLLGHMETNGAIDLPAIMHFPDRGTFQISVDSHAVRSLGYAGPYDGKVVQITFPGATREHPWVKYHWLVAEIHPALKDMDSRFDGFRRDWLNIFQYSPHWRMLANHVTSDTCAFCYYEYADIAAATPSLGGNVSAMDMVRQTLDRIIGGANAYGMPGHGAFPEFATDTLPSLLIAADDYVRAGRDHAWLSANYVHLKSWADQMLATDKDGDGLIKYMLSGNSGSWPERLEHRPANWWDTIGFGHEDAYANALAYRALQGMETLAGQSHHRDDEARYRAAADKIKAVYFKTFYNPETGVLAGWRSADGQLHDYYFLWVNGIAIHYGLVPKDKANAIMDRLLAKMKEVGYTRFDLGLPGNLIPVARKDYVDHNPRFGGGRKDDNTDGFQIYENGGATACFAYFTVAALYDLGRIQDADRIFMPMLDSFAKGDFQGRDASGMSKDWRTWAGKCWGYEGMLTDNYYALLAVMDREKALPRIGIIYNRDQAEKMEQGAHRLTSYARAIEENGGTVVVLSPLLSAHETAARLDSLDGLLLPGGEDVNPARYREKPDPKLEACDNELDTFEFNVLDGAAKRGVETLGICRGLQVLNVWAGGTLCQDIPSKLGTNVIHRQLNAAGEAQPCYHDIVVERGSFLGMLFGTNRLTVNSYHHQGVDRLAGRFHVSARSDDGLVEAFEDQSGTIEGVQFHPERLRLEPEHADFNLLFSNFVAHAAMHRAQRGR